MKKDKEHIPVIVSVGIISFIILAILLLKDVFIGILAFLSEGGWRLVVFIIVLITITLLISHAKGD